jgi:hypothetical protein
MTVATLVLLTVTLIVFVVVYGTLHASSWQVVVPVVAMLGLPLVAVLCYTVEYYAPQTPAEKRAFKAAIDRFLVFRSAQDCVQPREICNQEVVDSTQPGTPERASGIQVCAAQPTRTAACGAREAQGCDSMLKFAHPTYREAMENFRRKADPNEFLNFCSRVALAQKGDLEEQGY